MASSKNVEIYVNAKGNAEKALAKVNTQLKGTESQAKKTGAGLKTLAVAGAGLVVFNQASKWLKESARLAQVQEKAEVALATALGKTSQELLNYASALQEKTAIGDEEILQAQARLAVFVKDEEQLKALTMATIDFAQANKMDLNSAFALVGKSVGSSTNALTRYGIKVDGAVGSIERTNSAVENMNALFEGTAEAIAQTNFGKLQQAENTIGDLREEVGEKLLPAMLDIKTATVDFYEFILKNEGAILASVSNITKAVEIATKGFANLFGEEDMEVDAYLAQVDIATDALHQARIRIKELKDEIDKESTGLEIHGEMFGFSEANIEELVRKQMKWMDAEARAIAQHKELNDKWNASQNKLETVKSSNGKLVGADTKKTSGGAGGANEEAEATARRKKVAGEKSMLTAIWGMRKQLADDTKALGEDVAQTEQDNKQRLLQEEADLIEKRKELVQASLDAMQTISNSIFSAVQSRNNARQQEYDNEISRRKADVKSSKMSAKQKTKALEKIEAEAEKKRHEMRLKEWRQNLIMSIVNTALGVTKALSSAAPPANFILAGATAVAGGISTGVIASNKPKMYNGGQLTDPTGQKGDVIPFVGRAGETVGMPEKTAPQQTAVTIGAPQVVINGNVGQNEVSQIESIYDGFATRIENAFRNGEVNASMIKAVLA